jgi:cytochrome c553
MADYTNGLHESVEPKMGPPALMLAIGKPASEAEVKEAAEYLSSLKFKPWIRVVETNMAPKTKVAGWMLADEENGKEPIGSRIIETPENLERTELRDSKSSFYRLRADGQHQERRGAIIVKTGGADKTIRCEICHGADLKVLGNVPPLAGRSPGYVVRQMYDIKSGNRNGPWTQLMKEAMSKLTVDDMVSSAAYTASRQP